MGSGFMSKAGLAAPSDMSLHPLPLMRGFPLFETIKLGSGTKRVKREQPSWGNARIRNQK
jgi:hypothetical protein